MGIEVNLPYPDLDCIEKDVKSAELLSNAYCGNYGELTAILQYNYHCYYFNEAGDTETAKLLRDISCAEMHHFEIIGKTLLKLGVDPVFTRFLPYRCNYYNTSYVSYSKSPYKMLLDDINGELKAIDDYGFVISKLCNEQVSSVISRIILDEELHIKVLKDRIGSINI